MGGMLQRRKARTGTGEGHRTKIEVWDIKRDTPSDLIDIGAILGVWNLHFSPDALMPGCR